MNSGCSTRRARCARRPSRAEAAHTAGCPLGTRGTGGARRTTGARCPGQTGGTGGTSGTCGAGDADADGPGGPSDTNASRACGSCSGRTGRTCGAGRTGGTLLPGRTGGSGVARVASSTARAGGPSGAFWASGAGDRRISSGRTGGPRRTRRASGTGWALDPALLDDDGIEVGLDDGFGTRFAHDIPNALLAKARLVFTRSR
jgi:hypothetical protein